MRDSQYLESDGISQKPQVQEHLNAIECLKRSIKATHYVNNLKGLAYALSFLEKSVDDLR
jgi:hypothetical protein